jgi:hypothetical protein
MSDSKQITITGDAAKSFDPSSHAPRRKTQRAKKPSIEKEDPPLEKKILVVKGAGMSPGTIDQLSSTSVSGTPVSQVPLLAPKPVPIGGSTPPQKVILAKPEKVSKVFLGAPPKKKEPSKRRKTVKRVNVSIGGLATHLKRAKTIKNKSNHHTLEEIKDGLVKAGLIKADSKAPEDILRHMYSDFMILKKRAL